MIEDIENIKSTIKTFKKKIEFQIVYKCPMQWEDLKKLSNQDRARYCERCELKVYDLVGLSAEEVKELMRQNKDTICGQAYIRKDNKVMLQRCEGADIKSRGRIIER